MFERILNMNYTICSICATVNPTGIYVNECNIVCCIHCHGFILRAKGRKNLGILYDGTQNGILSIATIEDITGRLSYAEEKPDER